MKPGIDFELSFVIESPSDSVEDALLDLGVFLSNVGTTVVATLASNGHDAISAAQHVVAEIEFAGGHVVFFYDDLVSRSEIASRTGRTRQAVGNWVRGDRQDNFPQPLSPAAGGIWRWADVNAWLLAIGDDSADRDVRYPTWGEAEQIIAYLANRAEPRVTYQARELFAVRAPSHVVQTWVPVHMRMQTIGTTTAVS